MIQNNQQPDRTVFQETTTDGEAVPSAGYQEVAQKLHATPGTNHNTRYTTMFGLTTTPLQTNTTKPRRGRE